MTVINKEQPMREGEIAVVDYINGALADKIVELDATDAKLRADLTTETSERKEADTTLQNNIDSEADARVKQDTILQANIDAEAVLRDKADKVLQTNIDTEASERKEADTTLQTNIDTEVQNRTTNDAALQLAITNEQSARESAITSINTSITSINSDVSALQTKFPIENDSLSSDLKKTINFANTLPDIEFGISSQLIVPAKGYIECDVTFSNSKSEEPIVIGAVNVNASKKFLGCYVRYVTKVGATFVVFNDSDTEVTNTNVDWIAVSGR